jgi:hypothetical protein
VDPRDLLLRTDQPEQHVDAANVVLKSEIPNPKSEIATIVNRTSK